MSFTSYNLIISFIITWTIILTPPAIIRILFKKPIGRVSSICFCAILYLINLTLFIFLGSQSKSHAAILLGAFVSYWVLMYPKKMLSHGAIKEKREYSNNKEFTNSIIDPPLITVNKRADLNSSTINSSNKVLFRKILTKIMSLNYKKGLMRIWIVATVIWIPYVIYDAREQVVYTIHYHMDQSSLKEKRFTDIKGQIAKLESGKAAVSSQKVVPSGYREPFDILGLISTEELLRGIDDFTRVDEQDRSLDSMPKILRDRITENTKEKSKSLTALIDDRILILEKSLANTIIEKPDYHWFFAAFILPILLIPAAFVSYFVLIGGIKVIRWVCGGFSSSI